jgi:two-component system nitrate/nitrite response regulator NarL
MSTDATTIRVLIADDHSVVREGIRHVLGPEHGFTVVGEASRGDEVVALAKSLRPDVIVLDISMPGMTGLQAAEAIRAAQPAARILMLSIHENEEYVTRSERAGASGYLRKDSAPAELRAAVRAVHAGQEYFTEPLPGATASAPGAAGKLDLLTVREREVLVEIARGASNKEIAAAFQISVRTVESHRVSLMRKLELKGAAALTRFAIDTGLL